MLTFPSKSAVFDWFPYLKIVGIGTTKYRIDVTHLHDIASILKKHALPFATLPTPPQGGIVLVFCKNLNMIRYPDN